MPSCQIEDYQDSPQARADLIPWLIATDPRPMTQELWQHRFAHWWDHNPFANMRGERGWLLRHEGDIVGFMALIPACYAVNGRPTPAFIASTWRIDAEHRNASLPMFLKLRRLGAQSLIVDTTPSPEVQALMARGGWTQQCDFQRRFILLGWMGKLLRRGSWPALPASLRITRDPAEVQSVATPCLSSTSVEKWLTPDYLRWFTAATMRRHEFIGAIDSEGCLTSYLMLAPTEIRGLPAWEEIDHFTTDPTHHELHAIVGELVRRPALLGSARLLSLAAFPNDPSWDDAPVLKQRTEHTCHFFAIPESLKSMPKRTVLAEGDWGL